MPGTSLLPAVTAAFDEPEYPSSLATLVTGQGTGKGLSKWKSMPALPDVGLGRLSMKRLTAGYLIGGDIPAGPRFLKGRYRNRQFRSGNYSLILRQIPRLSFRDGKRNAVFTVEAQYQLRRSSGGHHHEFCGVTAANCHLREDHRSRRRPRLSGHRECGQQEVTAGCHKIGISGSYSEFAILAMSCACQKSPL